MASSLSTSPPSTRPRYGSHCVTFTRPFSAAVSSGNLQRSGGGGGGDRKHSHPSPCSTSPSATLPPPLPLGFLTSSLVGWEGTLSAETQGHSHRQLKTASRAYTHMFTIKKSPDHPGPSTHLSLCDHTRHCHTKQFSSLPTPQSHLVSFCVSVSWCLRLSRSLHLSPSVSGSLSQPPSVLREGQWRGASCQDLG